MGLTILSSTVQINSCFVLVDHNTAY